MAIKTAGQAKRNTGLAPSPNVNKSIASTVFRNSMYKVKESEYQYPQTAITCQVVNLMTDSE